VAISNLTSTDTSQHRAHARAYAMGAVTGRRHATGPYIMRYPPLLFQPSTHRQAGQPSAVPRTTTQADSQQDRPTTLRLSRPGRAEADQSRPLHRLLNQACGSFHRGAGGVMRPGRLGGEVNGLRISIWSIVNAHLVFGSDLLGCNEAWSLRASFGCWRCEVRTT
jgi:hypothetical protein